MTVRGLLIGWAAALLAFLVGEYGAGAALRMIADQGGIETAVTWYWLPWIGAPLLAGLAGGAFYPVGAQTRWWHWLVVAAPVPVGAGIVTRLYFVAEGVETPGLVPVSLVQLAIACALTLGIGLVRGRRYRDVATSDRGAGVS